MHLQLPFHAALNQLVGYQPQRIAWIEQDRRYRHQTKLKLQHYLAQLGQVPRPKLRGIGV